jgi:AcrR family transcriptional regulator
MSRTPSNKNILPLLKAKTKSLELAGLRCIGLFSMSDLADYAGVNQTSIHRYITGRKSLPNAEARLAAVFGISVETLRRKLGLPALKDRLPRETTGRQNKYGAFIESGSG